MEQHEVNKLASEVTLRVDAFYTQTVAPMLQRLAEDRDDDALLPAGYEVLFGPPLIGCEVLFVGFQPGGGPELGELHQPAHRDPMWPVICDFANEEQNYVLAIRLREIFTLDFLNRCCGTERNFFRSANSNLYAAWPNDLRSKTMDFCLPEVETLIRAIAPKRIAFIGSNATMDLVQNRTPVVQRAENGHFVFDKGTCLGIPAVACRHLTGGRARREESARITNELRKFCEQA